MNTIHLPLQLWICRPKNCHHHPTIWNSTNQDLLLHNLTEWANFRHPTPLNTNRKGWHNWEKINFALFG
jgi:hypothetical protein